MTQPSDSWHSKLEAHKALREEARKYKRRHPPSGEIFVYPLIQDVDATETDNKELPVALPRSTTFTKFVLPSVLASQARELEKLFSAREYSGKQDGPDIRVEPFGSLPVVLSAPHSVRHFPINREEKIPDLHTGSITLEIARLIGATAVVYAHTSKEEPNDDKPQNSPYKQMLFKVITRVKPYLFLDIHGLSDDVNAHLIIGNAYEKSIAGYLGIQAELQDTLRKAGIQKVEEHCAPLFSNPARYYCPDADYPTSNTLWVYNTFGIPALQLEIGWEVRDFNKHEIDYARFITAIANAIPAMIEFCEQVRGSVGEISFKRITWKIQEEENVRQTDE